MMPPVTSTPGVPSLLSNYAIASSPNLANLYNAGYNPAGTTTEQQRLIMAASQLPGIKDGTPVAKPQAQPAAKTPIAPPRMMENN